MIAIGPRLVTKAKLYMPWVGCWVLEASFDGDPPTGKVTVQWGKTAGTGTVLDSKSGVFVGQGVATIIGGIGWQKTPPAAWLIDTMARPAQVAIRLASSVDETLLPGIGSIREGRAVFSQASQPASATLGELLTPSAIWFVELNGTTRTALDRVGPTLDPNKVLHYDPASRTAVLAIEEPSEAPIGAVIPASGERFPEPQRIRELTMTADNKGVRAVVSFELPSSTAPRLASLIEKVVENAKARPHATFRAATVQSQDAALRVALRLEDRDKTVADPLPLAIWPGIPGASFELFAGTRMLLGFDRADPTKPFAALFSPKGEAGHVPQKIYLEASDLIHLLGASLGVAKVGLTTQPVALAPNVVAYLSSVEAWALSVDIAIAPLIAALTLLQQATYAAAVAARTTAAGNIATIPATRLEAE